MMTQCYGNPSLTPFAGAEAFRELETSRRAVARLIGARPEELTFTSGGTEANNLAVLGAAASRRREGRRVVTTAMEHASVAAACDELERQGFEVIRLAPGPGGWWTPIKWSGPATAARCWSASCWSTTRQVRCSP